jgi:CRP-like cAMP-binding protein
MIDLKKNSFFKGMNDQEISQALIDLKSTEKFYQRNDIILHAGNTTSRMGIVMEGSVTIEMNDAWGNCTILSHIGRNGIFSETYALLEHEVMPVDVRANEDCRILSLDLGGLRNSSSRDHFQMVLISNLLMICASKNLTLSSRNFHISSRTIRGKVLSYLNSQSVKRGNNEFDIPFDRQQMADYLNVDRTALSKELSNMKKDKLIDFRKNHFRLLI